MAQARIDWQGEKLFLHDTDGSVWRVHDCVVEGDRSRAIPLSDPRAVHRAFVGRDGTRRRLRFGPSTSRAIAPTLLQRQLRESTLVVPDGPLSSAIEPARSEAARRHG